jgi:hypothetical protein
MCNGAEINLIDGFNDIKFHDTLIKNYTEMIPLVANAVFKILFALAEIKEIKQTKGLNNCVVNSIKHSFSHCKFKSTSITVTTSWGCINTLKVN